MRRLTLLLAAMAVATGCSATPVAGLASPTSVSTSPVPTGIDLPERPGDLPLDGVDPCSLLTTEQRGDLGLDGNPLPGESEVSIFSGPTCSITTFEPRGVNVGIGLALRNGIEAITESNTVDDELTPISIGGFPAVVAKSLLNDFCSVDIDVADGQFLDIQFGDAAKDPPIPQDQLCEDAIRVAEAVIATLSAHHA